VLSISGPTNQGVLQVHQIEPPYLVRLQYLSEVAWYPRGAIQDRLTHSHSSLRQGTHIVGLGIICQGLLLYIGCVLHNRATSRRIWLFTMHRRSWVKRTAFRILNSWRAKGTPEGCRCHLSVTRRPRYGPTNST
jgi:hypothetical protein